MTPSKLYSRHACGHDELRMRVKNALASGLGVDDMEAMGIAAAANARFVISQLRATGELAAVLRGPAE